MVLFGVILSSVRPDVRLLANGLLGHIKKLDLGAREPFWYLDAKKPRQKKTDSILKMVAAGTFMVLSVICKSNKDK